MATKFADIEKPAKDLLNDDYQSKYSIKCKKNAGPVAVTLETERGKGGALTSKVSTKSSYGNFSVDKCQHNANGGQVLETSLKLTPAVKLLFKANPKSADLGVDYVSGSLYATGTLDVMEMSKLSTSACLGLPASGMKFGGDATYGLSGGSSGIKGFSVGASYASGPAFCSLTATNKLSQFNLGIKYKIHPDVIVASQTVHTSSKPYATVAVGAAFYNCPLGTIKAKVAGDGKVSASVIHEVVPKVTVTASGSVSPSDLSTFKPGIGINF